jgi:hypothetical protein
MAMSPKMASLLSNAKKKYASNGERARKPKEGKNRIRILTSGADTPFWRDLGVHWIKPDENANPVAVVGCASHTLDQPCEICTAIEQAVRQTSDDESANLIRSWAGRKSILIVALDRSEDRDNAEPIVYELTPTTFTAILDVLDEYSEQFFDEETGLDIIITREGKGLNTKYTVMPAPKSSPVPPEVKRKMIDLDDWIEKQFFRGDESKALAQIANITGTSLMLPGRSAGKVAQLTSASVADEDDDDIIDHDFSGEDEDEGDTPPPPKKKATVAKKPVKKSVAEPEDDDDDIDDISEEELEDVLGELDD